ncbi:MAG TPA: hypothetical protein VHA35_15460 [Dongiaceae bacterium]|nr:hypothetical protein [Dongiaceae bacterium]
MTRRFALAIAALLGLAALPAAAQEISGTFGVKGETAGGTAYQGSVAIATEGAGYRVAWQRDADLERQGFALRYDRVLGVAAEDQDAFFGVVLYRVKGGHLTGIWQNSGSPIAENLGFEDLDGPEGLDGVFIISRGVNPNGTVYQGDVTIKKSGAIYLVDWRTPNPSFIGTGVLLGDTFVVGYAVRHRSGVVAYCIRSGEMLDGVSGEASDSATGTETLRRGDAATVEAPAPGSCGVPVASGRAPASGMAAAAAP